MYDTIGLHIDKSFLRSGADDLHRLVLPKLDRWDRDYKVPGKYNGSLGNLSVWVTPYWVNIQGSLPKWYLGDNLQTINRQQTKFAIEKLSDYFSLPMDKARLTRIDTAANLTMKYPLDVYFGRFGELIWFKKVPLPNGWSYRQQNRQLEFYDKIAEMKIMKVFIPPIYQDRHILRYEYRYLHKLRRSLNVTDLRGKTLYNDTFYQMLVKRWETGYFAIEKTILNINDTPMDFETPAKMLEIGFRMLLQEPGKESAFIQSIQECQKMGKLNKMQAKRLRDQIRKVKEDAGSPADRGDEVLIEMDESIRAAAMLNGAGGANRKGKQK